ncbi:MAG TPA: methyltransferase domain-containing protein [Solirubrobacteraceae bacterium]|nr:methyltransferase domain-containing protein [Solirubrobacteraceae bacterium]
MSDPDEQRQASIESWEAAASGWRRRQEMMRELSAPVSSWMLDALDPQPGERILELAAGVGETGLLAASRVAPDGSVLISDQAQAMLDAARERAAELGLTNVEFRQINAEWIDLPTASVDGVLCRWGYMLMVDAETALRETRRVLAPGRRVALAAWDDIAANPWFAAPALELVERGLIKPPPAGAPGPFALSDATKLSELLHATGFTGVVVEAVDIERRHPDFDEFWESTLDFSAFVHDAVMALPSEQIDELRASLARRLAPFTAPDGSLSLPGRTLVAAASA